MKHDRGSHTILVRLGLSLLTILFLTAMAGSATASTPLEGVWSFNGGKIAIHQEGSSEQLVGTVIAPTTFAACPHQVGEVIWSDITLQADGSWWGRHQWFYEDGSCTPNPELGETAFRVLPKGDGHYLRVCLSEPGSAEQPTIAAGGTTTGATFGCVDSELISGLSTGSDLRAAKLIALHGGATCRARRSVDVKIREPAGDAIVKAEVTVSGGGVVRREKLVKRGKDQVAIVRTGAIPGATFVVSVTLTTALGHTIKSKRTYRHCMPVGRHRKRRRAHA